MISRAVRLSVDAVPAREGESMKFRIKTTLATLAASLLLAGSAFADQPTDYVKAKTEVVTKTLQKPDSKKRQQELQKVLDETIDFSELAARSLGDHWAKRSAEEQAEFLALLRDMLQANYEGKLQGQKLGADYEIKYDDEKTRGDKAIVKTTVVTKDGDKPVEYKLVQKGDDWVIFDVVIDDISLEETYRESYVQIIEKEGWPALIQRMKDKSKELRKLAAEQAKAAKKQAKAVEKAAE